MKTTPLFHLYLPLVLLAGILLAGCIDNTVNTIEEEGALTAELTISSDHVYTLSEVTFTVKVSDQHGQAMTGLETVEVQRKMHGSDDWSGIELELSGNVYTGTYTFMSSGEYDLQVAWMRHGSNRMEIMHNVANHFNVGRAHVEEGNYRIEYEHFPGQMHEGNTAQVKFWIFENEEDESGERSPVSGIEDLHIHCSNPDGTEEHHTAVSEEEAGVYADMHTFMGAGTAYMGMHFTDENGAEIEAEFTFDVAHGH